ncbi:alkaline phosphatase [Streptomyces oceani]|uniref:Alkaline phosphatase n=1 Tax=Streptomyces oceani TaxID=1075402 RepID=A0A1E7JZI9_9ACTN|nr:alkaline phosphatase D family protein [Streptomyces oceani]OEU97107.1 alkaline phosphatase [Streptomyces oceani]
MPLTTGATTARGADPAFAHGVASGDPLPDGVLLWTRVTPEPAAVPGSGKGDPVEVSWEIAEDPDFRTSAGRGSLRASADSDHTVKVDARGLRPATDYWYRFSVAGVTSPTGRTRTTPAADAATDRLRFATVSCASWESGWFAAYRHLAERSDLDAVLHLGDFVYEYGTGEYPTEDDVIRPVHPPEEVRTLAGYRARHGHYHTDPDLRAMQAAHPLIAIWDDHEFANDAWTGGAENHTPGEEGDWARRVRAAKQAYFEWMPVRPAVEGTTYRRLRFGRLADLHLLDLRSFRDQQPTFGDGDQIDDPNRTLTGRRQLDWLKSGLSASEATWRLVGTSVMISPVAFGSVPTKLLGPLAELLGVPRGGLAVNVDQWDGYTDDRRELLSHLRDNRIDNTVFLTGDIHMHWANEVPVSAADYPQEEPVATEFVVTSVTSDNVDDILRAPPNTLSGVAESAVRAANRHVRWLDMDAHGYAVLELSAEHAQMDFYALSDKTDPEATSAHLRSYRCRSGHPGLERTDHPVS